MFRKFPLAIALGTILGAVALGFLPLLWLGFGQAFHFDDYLPRFSPTGSRVAFTSDRDGVHEIYVMNSDGTGVTRVTFGDENGTYRDVQPTWSADETEIVYQRSALIGSQTNELYSIRLVASATRVGDPRNAATRISSGGFPSWYP